jgi:hypothetical protein
VLIVTTVYMVQLLAVRSGLMAPLKASLDEDSVGAATGTDEEVELLGACYTCRSVWKNLCTAAS